MLKTCTHSSVPFVCVVLDYPLSFLHFLHCGLMWFGVAVKEEEEAAVAAMDELAEANKEFLQEEVVGEEALEYVKPVFMVQLLVPTII